MKREELEQKVQKIEGKFPRIVKEVEPFNGANWGMHWNGGIQDINYIETLDYQVAAARWNKHSWGEGGGGVKWTDWISVYYKRKDSQEKIKKVDTEKIVTRDQYDPKKDRTDLWGYNNASLEKIEDNKIRTSWANSECEKKLSYIIDLDKEEK